MKETVNCVKSPKYAVTHTHTALFTRQLCQPNKDKDLLIVLADAAPDEVSNLSHLLTRKQEWNKQMSQSAAKGRNTTTATAQMQNLNIRTYSQTVKYYVKL